MAGGGPKRPPNSKVFRKCLKETFCKGFGLKNFMLDCLEAAWKSRVAKKNVKLSKFEQITTERS